MSYLKMLGLARGRLSAAGLFSTAVISGSSSAPNLRVMIPQSNSNATALEGFAGVPAIRPLETLHNALSLRQLDDFLERVTAAPVLVANKPDNSESVCWSGPSSLMSSSSELPSALSSAGPSSPNTHFVPIADPKVINADRSSIVTGKHWECEGASTSLHVCTLANRPVTPISGNVTPVSLASDVDVHSNEATAGSLTDQDIVSGDEDIECNYSLRESPLTVIRNELTDIIEPSTSQAHMEYFDPYYKDLPNSSKNFNHDTNKESWSSNDSLYFNNGSRRNSDKNQTNSRFTTVLVDEQSFNTTKSDQDVPLLTKVETNVAKPGFSVDNQ